MRAPVPLPFPLKGYLQVLRSCSVEPDKVCACSTITLTPFPHCPYSPPHIIVARGSEMVFIKVNIIEIPIDVNDAFRGNVYL